MTEYKYKYNAVLRENTSIDKTLKQMNEMASTDNSKYIHENKELQKITFIHNVLFVAYYLTFIVFCFFLFKQPMQIFIKIIVVIVVILYPYFIFPLEYWTFNGLYFVFTLITGNVYIKQDF